MIVEHGTLVWNGGGESREGSDSPGQGEGPGK